MRLLLAIFVAVLLSACERGPQHTELCRTLTTAEVVKRHEPLECKSGEGGDWVHVCLEPAWSDLRCRDSYSIWKRHEERGQCRECFESWDW